MRLNADSKMLGDPRFKKLGQRLGMTHFEAFGRVLPVWMMAYENRSEFMSGEDVDALAELAGFADGMRSASLADTAADGRLRLRGVAERIEFLLEQDRKREMAMQAKREKRPGRPAGHPPGPGLPAGHPPGPSRGESPGTIPRDVPRDVPISPDLALSPDLDLALDPPPPQKPPTGAADPHLARRQEIRRGIWHELESARGAVAAELGITYRPLPAHDQGERDLAMYLAGPQGAEVAAEDARHAIAVAAEEARAKRSLEWFSGVIFGDKQMRRAAGMDPAKMRAARTATASPGTSGRPARPKYDRDDDMPAGVAAHVAANGAKP